MAETKYTPEKFVGEWMTNSFYWLEGDRLSLLQEIAFKCGLKWHTGDSDFVSTDYPHDNLWFSKEGVMQSLPFYSELHRHGEPKDFLQMLKSWEDVVFTEDGDEELNDTEIVDQLMSKIPVGDIKTHTRNNLVDRVMDLVKLLAEAENELEQTK